MQRPIGCADQPFIDVIVEWRRAGERDRSGAPGLFRQSNENLAACSGGNLLLRRKHGCHQSMSQGKVQARVAFSRPELGFDSIPRQNETVAAGQPR